MIWDICVSETLKVGENNFIKKPSKNLAVVLSLKHSAYEIIKKILKHTHKNHWNHKIS